jgi:hypothetical protein
MGELPAGMAKGGAVIDGAAIRVKHRWNRRRELYAERRLPWAT